ncbi:molybdopterin molybdotransferase MoeA [Aquibaculum sediminis]|uniref:molybdopterin molybdotransferase MoeA n=1 Tax=Aquibaculum sediminis TaxID=3231907 RepID=UPI0034535B3D
MISVEEARTRILEAFSPLPAEVVAIDQALGRVLAAPVIARTTQPPKAVSAMDGYAVKAADVAQAPVRLRVVGAAPAGGDHDGILQSGEAVRIFTGGPLPRGADAIVIQEDTDSGEDTEGSWVEVRVTVPEGHYVRPAGLDFSAGDRGPEAGQRLGVRDIGLAAAMDQPWLTVHRKPRVAILATGDEVVMPGEPRGPNQIVSSNGLALQALVRSCGGEAINLGIAEDNRDSLLRLAAGAQGADLLVTTGGASVGEHDLIRSVLGEDGLELNFWKIAMRPGKPLLFGHLRETPLLGLPGNPVSSLVCGLIFLRPILARLQGLDTVERTVTARLGKALPANDKRQDYLRTRLTEEADGSLIALPFTRQDSSMMATLAQADGLLIRTPSAPPAEPGELVSVLPLAEGRPGL